MTMDINPQQRGKLHVDHSAALISDLQGNVSSPESSSTPPSLRCSPPKATIPEVLCYSHGAPAPSITPARTVKRSFDVAFLMAPDANLAKKQQQRREYTAAENCSRKQSSPTIAPAPFRPASPKILTSSKNSLLNVIHDSSSKHNKDMALLEGVIESVSRNSFILRSVDPFPKNPTMKPVAITKQQSSNLGVFEETNVTVARTNHQEVIEQASKFQATFNGKNELNVMTTSRKIEDFSREDYHQTCGKESIIGSKNYIASEAHNPCRVLIRSAFTKVTTSSKKIDSRTLPSPTAHASPLSVPSLSSSLSPDHTTYQESMSPPVLSSEPSTPQIPSHFIYSAGKPFPSSVPVLIPNSHLSRHIPTHAAKTFTSPYSSGAFLLQQDEVAKSSDGVGAHSSTLPSTNGSLKGEIESYLMKASIASPTPHQICGSVADAELIQYFPGNSSSPLKLRPSNLFYQHHPESMASYPSLSAGAYPFTSAGFPPSAAELLATRSQPPGLLPGPAAAAAAAAVVSASLLPPSFAALSLPAQNICAKCNISFRMTSDLVYHMRSHHKGDHASSDSLKRRRDQDKLKCPVCNESFRERHHLTRHMTAHQDKEGDATEDADDGGDRPAALDGGAGRRRFPALAGHGADK